jgi:hypothetical protein
MTQIISLPPATDVTIKPAGGSFAFYLTSTSNVCFGTANPAGSFPSLENQTFLWQAGSTVTFPIPSSVGAKLPYNASNPGVVCTAGGITDNGKIIVVGSGMIKRKKKSKAKPKKAAKKAASKKAVSKTAAKRKAAPKKKAPAKKKAKAKKAAKKGKKASRSRRR